MRASPLASRRTAAHQGSKTCDPSDGSSPGLTMGIDSPGLAMKINPGTIAAAACWASTAPGGV